MSDTTEQKKLTPDQEFDQALNKIGKLYEEGKDCLNKIYLEYYSTEEKKDFARAMKILQELRDIACVELRKLYKGE